MNYPRMDIHIHTEATTPYQQGDANLLPYYQRGQATKLDFMAITDHYHYLWQKTRYVRAQREYLDHQKFNAPEMFLGVEQTILGNGRIGIRESGLKYLNFIILSIHWMNPGGRLGREEIKKIFLNSKRTVTLEKAAKFLYQKAVSNPKINGIPKILGHPFNFLMRPGILSPNIFGLLEWLCQFCATNGVAFELNSSDVKQAIQSNSEIGIYWMEMIKKYQPLIAVSSDAHHLDRIGQVDDMYALLEKAGIPANLCITSTFFRKI